MSRKLPAYPKIYRKGCFTGKQINSIINRRNPVEYQLQYYRQSVLFVQANRKKGWKRTFISPDACCESISGTGNTWVGCAGIKPWRGISCGFWQPALFCSTSLEIAISRELQEEKHPVLTAYMQFVSWFGYNQTAIPTILLTALLFSLFSYWREALFTLLTSLASVINSGLKLLIDRPRPTADVVEIYSTLQTNSFPSGHVVHYVVFFGFLLIVLYRLHRLNTYLRLVLALFFVLLIFSVPFSRMYLGAHWFIDVLAGFFLGLILLSGLLYFYFPANKRVE
jgi:membrane-associated phospholipid phosphatase